jgi:hypothetical protein
MVTYNFYGKIILATIRAVPAVIPHLTPETFDALKAAPGYEGIRNTYWAKVYDSVFEYLTSDQRVTSFKSRMSRAAVEAFGGTVDLAYEAGGGELPLDEETLAWLNEQVNAELGYISDLFDRLREEWDGIDPIHEAFMRADGYASRLDGIYGEAKMRGSKNVMLTWNLGATEKHCKTCAQLDGKSHKITWYIERDYIPRKSGAAMECGGWNCDCTLTDKDGNEYSV